LALFFFTTSLLLSQTIGPDRIFHLSDDIHFKVPEGLPYDNKDVETGIHSFHTKNNGFLVGVFPYARDGGTYHNARQLLRHMAVSVKLKMTAEQIAGKMNSIDYRGLPAFEISGPVGDNDSSGKMELICVDTRNRLILFGFLTPDFLKQSEPTIRHEVMDSFWMPEDAYELMPDFDANIFPFKFAINEHWKTDWGAKLYNASWSNRDNTSGHPSKISYQRIYQEQIPPEGLKPLVLTYWQRDHQDSKVDEITPCQFGGLDGYTYQSHQDNGPGRDSTRCRIFLSYGDEALLFDFILESDTPAQNQAILEAFKHSFAVTVAPVKNPYISRFTLPLKGISLWTSSYKATLNQDGSWTFPEVKNDYRDPPLNLTVSLDSSTARPGKTLDYEYFHAASPKPEAFRDLNPEEYFEDEPEFIEHPCFTCYRERFHWMQSGQMQRQENYILATPRGMVTLSFSGVAESNWHTCIETLFHIVRSVQATTELPFSLRLDPSWKALYHGNWNWSTQYTNVSSDTINLEDFSSQNRPAKDLLESVYEQCQADQAIKQLSPIRQWDSGPTFFHYFHFEKTHWDVSYDILHAFTEYQGRTFHFILKFSDFEGRSPERLENAFTDILHWRKYTTPPAPIPDTWQRYSLKHMQGKLALPPGLAPLNSNGFDKFAGKIQTLGADVYLQVFEHPLQNPDEKDYDLEFRTYLNKSATTLDELIEGGATTQDEAQFMNGLQRNGLYQAYMIPANKAQNAFDACLNGQDRLLCFSFFSHGGTSEQVSELFVDIVEHASFPPKRPFKVTLPPEWDYYVNGRGTVSWISGDPGLPSLGGYETYTAEELSSDDMPTALETLRQKKFKDCRQPLNLFDLHTTSIAGQEAYYWLMRYDTMEGVARVMFVFIPNPDGGAALIRLGYWEMDSYTDELTDLRAIQQTFSW